MREAVFDTNALSYIFNRHTLGPHYSRLFLECRNPIISHVTVVEQYYGVYRRGWGANRIQSLERFLESFRVIYPDGLSSRKVAQMQAALENRGINIGNHDMWIATTALILQCPVVTHNAKHFGAIEGLEVRSANVVS